jgi:hypothetical protein
MRLIPGILNYIVDEFREIYGLVTPSPMNFGPGLLLITKIIKYICHG